MTTDALSRRRRSTALPVLAGCVALPVHAASTATDAAGGPLAWESLLQMSLGLVAVLVAIVGMAWLARRFGRFQSPAGGILRILGGLSLGPRERVVLLQVGNVQLLVGVAPGRIQTLHVLGSAPASAARGEETFSERLGVELAK